MVNKVLFIVSSLEKCGPTNQLLNIVKNLNKSLFDVYIVTLKNESQNSDLLQFENLQISVITPQFKAPKLLTNYFSYLKNIIKKIKPDIIHTQGSRPDFISALFFRNYKRVSTL